MTKSFDAVDAQHRNLVAVLREQLCIGLDVNFREFIEFVHAGLRQLLLHLFTQTAVGFGVENYARLRFHSKCPSVNSILSDFVLSVSRVGKLTGPSRTRTHTIQNTLANFVMKDV